MDTQAAKEGFNLALTNDLDTAAALKTLADLADAILVASAQAQNVTEAQDTLRQLGSVFGLRLNAPEPEARVIAGWDKHIKRFAA